MTNRDQEITALTGLHQEQINEIRFETALTFLEQVLGLDAYGLEVIPKTPLFWAWWRTEWTRVDERFLDAIRYDVRMGEHYITLPDRKERNLSGKALHYWLSFHEASPDNYYMGADLIHASYHQLIKSLTK